MTRIALLAKLIMALGTGLGSITAEETSFSADDTLATLDCVLNRDLGIGRPDIRNHEEFNVNSFYSTAKCNNSDACGYLGFWMTDGGGRFYHVMFRGSDPNVKVSIVNSAMFEKVGDKLEMGDYMQGGLWIHRELEEALQKLEKRPRANFRPHRIKRTASVCFSPMGDHGVKPVGH